MRKTLIIAAAATALIAGQAAAHARLLTASPKAGETVASPQKLVLHYSETIVPTASSVTVTGPGGAPVATGPLALGDKDKREVTVAFSAPLRPGAYKVAWKMHTPDDHNTDGTFAFKVK
ncbi:MAG: copper homeostasis periplasmic binding protein CopC [Caulobacteraceae bacterium]